MNILRVAHIPHNRTGGASRYMILSGDALQAMGHTVEYLMAEELGDCGPPRLRRFTIPWQVVRQVRERLRAGHRYDVVEIHEPIAAAYCLLRRRWRLPPVTVACYAAERRANELWRAYRRDQGLPVSLKQRIGHRTTIAWQADLAMRRADQVKVETTEDAEYLQRRLGVAAERISIVHGGVSDEFRAAYRTAAQETTRRGILFLGTWLERKGSREVATAVSRILADIPDCPVTLAGTLVGDEEVRRAFPESVRSRLEVIPKLETDAALARVFARRQIFLLPSIVEGLPLVLLEAASAGLAIVTTRRCGMKDFIRDGQEGLLQEPGDPVALEANIRRLLENQELAHQLGQAAQAKAQQYTWTRSAIMYLEAFSAAIRHAGGPPPESGANP